MPEMPIPKDEFRTIDDDATMVDLSRDTTQGAIYHFLLQHADEAFRQREIVEAVDVPQGSVGPTLARLERRGVVEHRGRYWAVADAEHATASAGLLGAASADDVDGGFTDADVAAWMETAVDPAPEHTDDEGS